LPILSNISQCRAVTSITRLTGVIAILCSACSVLASPQANATSKAFDVSPLKAVAPRTILDETKFGLNLLAIVRKSDSGNIALSPYCVNAALLLALNGAHGSTATALRKGLQIDNQPLGKLDGDNRIIGDTLAADSLDGMVGGQSDFKPELSIDSANAIWVQRGWPIYPDYIALCHDRLGAAATSVDFTNPTGAEEINTWVSKKTHNLIPTLVTPDQIVSDKLVLTSALYFRSDWETPFNTVETHLAPFTKSVRNIQTVPTMRQIAWMDYEETPLCQMAELPYGYGRWRFLIILPRPGRTVDGILSVLGAQGLATAPHNCTNTRVDISLPKFEIHGDYDLRSALQNLGMGLAFSRRDADFSGISANGLNINSVVHKTVLKVDEHGTSAAAETAVDMMDTSSAPSGTVEVTPKIMKVDRPFFFAIQDSITGLVLLEGVVENPKS